MTAVGPLLGERLTACPIGELVDMYVAQRKASGAISHVVAINLRSDLRRFVADVGPVRRGGAVSVRDAARWAREREGQQQSQGRWQRTAVAFLDWIHADGHPQHREPSALQVVLTPPIHPSGSEQLPLRTIGDLADHYLQERVARRDLGISTARNHRSTLMLFATIVGDREPQA